MIIKIQNKLGLWSLALCSQLLAPFKCFYGRDRVARACSYVVKFAAAWREGRNSCIRGCRGNRRQNKHTINPATEKQLVFCREGKSATSKSCRLSLSTSSRSSRRCFQKNNTISSSLTPFKQINCCRYIIFSSNLRTF